MTTAGNTAGDDHGTPATRRAVPVAPAGNMAGDDHGTPATRRAVPVAPASSMAGDDHGTPATRRAAHVAPAGNMAGDDHGTPATRRAVPVAPAMVLPVGEAWHAVSLDVVREVVPAVPVAAVPDAPAWLRGLANLRGSIIPVVDTGRGFGGPATGGVTHLVLADTAVGVAALVASGTPAPADLGEPAGPGEHPGAAGRFAVGERVATLLDLDVLCEVADP